jgi:6-phosphogluconate dehydrogenase
MEVGFVGLGKMGMNMVARLRRDQHRVVAFDLDPAKRQELAALGAEGAASLEELVRRLAPPRAAWVMVPAGKPTEETITTLAQSMNADDTIIDGGNTNFHDDIRRAAELKKRAIHYLDAGTSGGVWGLKVGYCLMVGGEEAIFRRCEPLFKTLAPPNGYAYMGQSGAGHFVKMVHNGIEYGLMQAYAEGFECLHRSEFNLDLAAIARLWGQGSVVRSWLLELCADALAKDPKLENILGYVEDSGEGRWTVLEAIARDVSLPVITLSLFARFRSRVDQGATGTFGERLLAAMRNEFGGHATVRR